MLNEFLRPFDDCFGRSEPVEPLRTYVTGQLSDLPRKSLEPIADAAGARPRNLQQFLSLHAWDEERMRDLLQQRVARDHGHPVSIGVIDDTGHPKKGDKTPGVQRQWCGNAGKIDNCVVTVHLAYTAGDFRCLLDGEPILRKAPWEKFYVKDTNKGPMVWEAKVAPFYLKREGLPTWPHGLLVARNTENHDERKYFVSNAPAGTPVEVLLHVAFSRWPVERCFEDEKGDLGLSHFEVRTWRSLRRHLILTAVSHLFLAEVHDPWRGEKSGTDGLAGPHGHLGAGPVALDDRPGESGVPGAGGGDQHADPGSPGPLPSQPRQNQTPAAA